MAITFRLSGHFKIRLCNIGDDPSSQPGFFCHTDSRSFLTDSVHTVVCDMSATHPCSNLLDWWLVETPGERWAHFHVGGTQMCFDSSLGDSGQEGIHRNDSNTLCFASCITGLTGNLGPNWYQKIYSVLPIPFHHHQQQAELLKLDLVCPWQSYNHPSIDVTQIPFFCGTVTVLSVTSHRRWF